MKRNTVRRMRGGLGRVPVSGPTNSARPDLTPTLELSAIRGPDEPPKKPSLLARTFAPFRPVSGEPWPPRSPFKNVQWTFAYAAFLLYIFVTTTYRIPIGDVSMVLALAGLALDLGNLRRPGLLAWFGAFVLWCSVSFTQTAFPEPAWTALILICKIWLITLTAVNVLRSRAHIRLFMVFFLACFAFYPVRGALFNYYLYRESLRGRALWLYIYENPNDLASLCLLQLSMAVALAVTEKKGPVKYAALAGCIVLPLLILLTQSRGAFLALVLTSGIALFANRKKARRLMLAAAVGSVVVFLAPGGVWSRLRQVEVIGNTSQLQNVADEGSAFQRYEIWKVARKIIRTHPLFGVGLGAYPYEHYRTAMSSEFNPTARGGRDTHSTYLNVTAETGFVGFGIFAGIFLSTIIYTERIRRKWKRLLPRGALQLFVLEMGLLSFFFAAVFSSMSLLPFLYIHLALIWSVAEALKRDAKALAHSSAANAVPPAAPRAPGRAMPVPALRRR